MTTRPKFFLITGGAALAVFVVPIILSAFSSHAYFYEGRCMCGNDCFVRIQGNGLFKYSPGHGMPEYRAYTLRPTADGWDIMGLPHSDFYTTDLEGEDKVIGHLSYRDGVLYRSWGKSTKALPRTYNIWKVWWGKFCEYVAANFNL